MDALYEETDPMMDQAISAHADPIPGLFPFVARGIWDCLPIIDGIEKRLQKGQTPLLLGGEHHEEA